MKKKSPSERPLASNRRARRDYEILETFEAGIVLTGTEVKSVRQRRIQLQESHVEIRDAEAWLLGAHISPYTHGNRENHETDRPRKLLLHRRQLDKLFGRTLLKGQTIVPLSVYLSGNRIKLEIALARGRRQYDKRQVEKQRILDREAEEAIASRRS